jgi:hypothetical protein
MTLLITEIHVSDSLQNSRIWFAADQRISLKGKRIDRGEQCKIFQIPYLNAGVGFFGLAQVNSNVYLSDWLYNFINRQSNTNVKTLKEFTRRVCSELNLSIHKPWLSEQVSGLHICGYNENELPEFWVVRNSDRFEDGEYKDLKTDYYYAEECLARDASKMGFDGVTPSTPGYHIQAYINGDIYPYHLIWRDLDKLIQGLFATPNFDYPQTPNDMEKVIKWKMRVITSFYKNFARKQIIGGSSDAFVLHPKFSSTK